MRKLTTELTDAAVKRALAARENIIRRIGNGGAVRTGASGGGIRRIGNGGSVRTDGASGGGAIRN